MKAIWAACAAGALLCAAGAVAAPPLATRIGHSDPAGFRESKGPHGGAGSMQFGSVLGADALSTNFIFLHRGVIAPGGGIGQHFHNQCEEMFVILDGEAEFTIDGRTARIAGPAGVPDRMGHAHGIYNHTGKPLQWLNINVGTTKQYDNFDLGDPRTGAALDPIPQFITMRLDRALLKPREGDPRILWRRALDPAVFSTPWSYVDHLVIAPGGALPAAAQPDMSEVYYVLGGEGQVTIGSESAAIRVGDAVPVDLGETRTLRQAGAAPLELMVIGVARDQEAKARFRAATAPRRR